MTFVTQKFTKLMRQIRISQGVRVGEKLNRTYRARAGIDAALWPEDWAYLTAEIERLEWRLSKIRDYLRKSAIA